MKNATTRTRSRHALRWAVRLGACALVLVGCADALRLEPPGAGTGTGGAGNTPGVGGGGGMAPIGCSSNSDCPEPTNVCDTVKGICVECLEDDHCGTMLGTVCSQGACLCPEQLTWCGPDVCVDTETSQDHCGQCDSGCFGACSAGACVDPWRKVGSEDAPSPRGRHVAVWTGSDMIVWGGSSDTGSGNNFGSGAIYDPADNSWAALSGVNAPSPRQLATAVWTGSEMIVWGGRDGSAYPADGGIFDPSSNTWSPITTIGAPEGRIHHTAVWTGSEMIVWGGQSETDQLANGARYDPAADSWTTTPAVPSPSASRRYHSAVWDGAAMVVFGGYGDIDLVTNQYWPSNGVPGGRVYSPAGNGWDTTSPNGEPGPRDRHTAVWDGTAMLLFGGYDGNNELGVGFKLEGDGWVTFDGDAPSPRREHTAVWLDDLGKMVVFGGINGTVGKLADGAVYDAATNSWESTVPTALAPRSDHTAVSTGSEMIVWGGFGQGNQAFGDGGIFAP